MLGCTGNNHWKMPYNDLHGMTRDEPCSCSISCGRINSVHRINCGRLVVLCGNTWSSCRNAGLRVVLCRMWKHHCTSKGIEVSLLGSSLSSSLEIILSTELLYLSG